LFRRYAAGGFAARFPGVSLRFTPGYSQVAANAAAARKQRFFAGRFIRLNNYLF
jgi:hypothetical protein